MLELNSQIIPAWVVSILMLYTAFVWFISRRRRIAVDSDIFAITFFMQGLVYGIIYQFLNVDVEVRGFFSRLMIIMLCLSQSLPLTVSYIRSFYKHE